MSDETNSESVYERARKALSGLDSWNWLKGNHPAMRDVISALDAGEAAEKRARKREGYRLEADRLAKEWEKVARERDEAIILLNPARPEDGLLPAIRDVMQRLALAEAGRSDDA